MAETIGTTDINYSEYRAWPAEGARVGLVTCMRCGAALLLDPYGPNPIEIHNRFHADTEESTHG